MDKFCWAWNNIHTLYYKSPSWSSPSRHKTTSPSIAGVWRFMVAMATCSADWTISSSRACSGRGSGGKWIESMSYFQVNENERNKKPQRSQDVGKGTGGVSSLLSINMWSRLQRGGFSTPCVCWWKPKSRHSCWEKAGNVLQVFRDSYVFSDKIEQVAELEKFEPENKDREKVN